MQDNKIHTRIGLGMAAIGRPEYINIRQTADLDKTEALYRINAFKMLDFAYKHGLRHFDTAPSYGKGEQFLQQWFEQHPYKDLILSTKWGYTYVANWQLNYQGPHEIKEHTLEKLTEQWCNSQKLLPALKVYQIHSATFESGVLENAAVLQKLFDIKSVTHIKLGVTTSGKNQKDVLDFASKIKMKGKYLFDSFQVTYNVLETSAHDVLCKLLDQGRQVIIKEALANGRVFRNTNYSHYEDLFSILEDLSKKYKVSIDAVAMRFVIDWLSPDILLSGASTIDQLSENLGALTFKLEYKELNMLNQYAVDGDFYWQERKKMNWN